MWNNHCHCISTELWILLGYWHRTLCKIFLDVCYVNVENQAKVLGLFFFFFWHEIWEPRYCSMTITFNKPFLLHHFFTMPNRHLWSTWREAGGLKGKKKGFYESEVCHKISVFWGPSAQSTHSIHTHPCPAWDRSKKYIPFYSKPDIAEPLLYLFPPRIINNLPYFFF